MAPAQLATEPTISSIPRTALRIFWGQYLASIKMSLESLVQVPRTETYTDEFAKRCVIKVELELADEGIERLPELVRIALFRILQESLTNVHRHSASPSVEVRLKVNHQAVLTVRDFGRGVPVELLQGSQASGLHSGVGLSGMRERVNDLGGTFEIQSSGNGTLIRVSIPLEAAAVT
jgi:signal transduction histidine kinase